MTWIKTVPASEDEQVRKAAEGQRHLYPVEYATPVHPTLDGETAGIVESHSLIPDALYHAFGDLRLFAVAGLAPATPPARDDRDYGFRY